MGRLRAAAGLGGVVAVLVATTLAVQPAGGATPDVSDEEAEQLIEQTQLGDSLSTTRIKEETFGTDGSLVSTRTFTPTQNSGSVDAPSDGSLIPRAAAATRGTAASASVPAGAPCRKVTVYRERRAVLGVMFHYNVWTRWCWSQLDQYIYPGGSNGWYVSQVNFTYQWRGEVNSSRYFYDAGPNNGKPRSAFRHYRQGKFEHCLVKYGCIATYYPSVSLRSYSDGSYTYTGAG